MMHDLPDIETTNLLHFSSWQGVASYALVMFISKSLVLHYKVPIHALSISVVSWPKFGRDVVKLREECR
jgi:hypothetical protein